MKWKKVIAKGIEGAVVAGGSTGLALSSPEVSVEDTEKAVATLVMAALGFAFRALRNWIKHRKD